MELSTPPARPRHSSSSTASSSIATPSTPTHGPRSSLHARRFVAPPGARDRGTPVGKVLAREGLAQTPGKSPRRVRQRSFTEKAIDWPSNTILSLSTSWELLSFDAAGLPLGIGLNVFHFLLRLPQFASALPQWLRTTSRSATGSRYWAKASELSTAEARLEALQRQASRGQRFSWGWTATVLSIVLVLVSFVNVAYLFTRRRRYHLMLRKDPLASPNARPTTLDFQPPRGAVPKPRRSFFSQAKRLILGSAAEEDEDEPKTFEVQQLDVWTPEYVKWSQRVFSLYPPPLALLYHFLTPSNILPLALIGALIVFQTTLLLHSYTHLLSDRSTLQSEVMHEYNARFVHPRLFVQKRDIGVSMIDAEFEGFKEEYKRLREVESSATKSVNRRSTMGGIPSSARYGEEEEEEDGFGMEVEQMRTSGRKLVKPTKGRGRKSVA